MAFMAEKALKRKMHTGKETEFCRNGIPVDPNKVESFKKQRLNLDTAGKHPMPRELDLNVVIFKELTLAATPQHISYETPKSVLISDSPSASPAGGSDLP